MAHLVAYIVLRPDMQDVVTTNCHAGCTAVQVRTESHDHESRISTSNTMNRVCADDEGYQQQSVQYGEVTKSAASAVSNKGSSWMTGLTA